MDVREMASMGQKAMRAKQSTAEKVFWPLQAGRPREQEPGLVEAVYIGRQAANKLYGAMREAKLSMKDGGCFLLFEKNGKYAGIAHYAFENEDAGDLEIVQEHLIRRKSDPVGITLVLLDREKGHVLTHARSFGSKEQSKHIVAAAHEELVKKFSQYRRSN